MVAPTPEVKAQMLATCMAGVLASPEAWRTYEHEALEAMDTKKPFQKSYLEWALARANHMARLIWIEACKPPKKAE